MAKWRFFFKYYSLSIVSGILIGTSYIPLPPWASLFCFVPLWWLWFRIADGEKTDTSATLKRIFLAGWITQFVLTLLGFNWIALTVHEFGLMPWPIAIVVLILFCGVANLDVPLAGVLWFYFHRRFSLPFRKSLALLGLITAILEAWVPTLFPWNYGYPWLWVQFPIAQVAELIGFQGLSSLVILANCGVFYFWRSRSAVDPAVKRGGRKAMAAVLVGFIGLNLAGWVLKQSLPEPEKEIQVGIIQANIGNLQKQQAEKGFGFRQHITDRYFSISQDAVGSAQHLDFVVWPETAYPYDIDQRLWSSSLNTYPMGALRLIEFSQRLGTAIITGGYGYSPRDGKLTNTFFIVEPSGLIQPHPYYKTILLAFGEYIPGAELYPKVKDWIPAGDFSRGPGPQIKDLNGIKIGPQICYEGLFPSFSNRLADLGAEVFINLTNDSWYGTWQEPYQHLYMTLGRAVEFRRPLVRATNTGISTVVLASGEVLQKSPMIEEWFGVYSIPFVANPQPTFYQLYPWLIDALLISMVLLVLFSARRKLGTNT